MSVSETYSEDHCAIKAEEKFKTSSDKTVFSYREMVQMNNYNLSEQMPHWFLRIPYLRFGYRYKKNMSFRMCL